MMYRLMAVEVARYLVLRLTFEDGLSGEIDLSEEIARGGIFEPLRDPMFFAEVQLADEGFSYGWRLDETGGEIDFSADGARAEIELATVKKLAHEHRTHRTAAE